MSKVPEQIEQLQPMLTPETVAQKLSVTPATIRNMCDRGDIPGARKVGRQWRIPVSYLMDEAA